MIDVVGQVLYFSSPLPLIFSLFYFLSLKKHSKLLRLFSGITGGLFSSVLLFLASMAILFRNGMGST
jgi:hypothetical protein